MSLLLTFNLLHVMQISLIANLLFGIILADNSELRYYNVVSSRYIHLETNSTEALIKINGTIYMKPYKKIPNSYIVGITSITSGIEIDNSEFINLSECKSNNILQQSFKDSFIVSYDENGLFKQILVPKHEQHLSINLKLFFTAFIQIPTTKEFQSRENEFSIQSKEPLSYGICTVNYNINKKKLAVNSMITYIQKIYDMQSCTRNNNNDILKEYSDYLTNECTNDSEDELKWDLTCELLAETAPNFSALHEIKFTEYISFKPLKKNPFLLQMNQSTQAYLMVQPSTIPKHDLHANTKVITSPIIEKINDSILKKDSNDAENQKLREIYRALACYKANQSIYLDLFERFILCKS